MNSSTKTIGISAATGLVIGLLVGYIPAHMSSTKLEGQNSALQQQLGDAQGNARTEQQRLMLSGFAVHAGILMIQAERNNYSVAAGSASGLFTELRNYVDHTPDAQTRQPISDVLAVRDRTIAGLAQANPAVKPLLQQLFEKLADVSAAASQAK